MELFVRSPFYCSKADFRIFFRKQDCSHAADKKTGSLRLPPPLEATGRDALARTATGPSGRTSPRPKTTSHAARRGRLSNAFQTYGDNALGCLTTQPSCLTTRPTIAARRLSVASAPDCQCYDCVAPQRSPEITRTPMQATRLHRHPAHSEGVFQILFYLAQKSQRAPSVGCYDVAILSQFGSDCGVADVARSCPNRCDCNKPARAAQPKRKGPKISRGRFVKPG